ncbi:MAG TPA: hypothetical protein VEA16_12965, partial [Vicinamibacterales bacterium]|nr:hypothetical protein [Vicinamibacterales bacterium]
SSNSYTWTPSAGGANYRVSVWARSGGSTEIYEAVNEGYYQITGAPAPPARVTGVSLAANLPSPQPANTSITWTATAAGGVSPQFKWILFDGSSWVTVREWSPATTFVWTPASPHQHYRMSVWARSGGSTEVYEATTEAYFAITGVVQIPRVSSVSLTTNVAPPQAPNTTITWTATANVGPAQYKWWFFDGAAWSMVRDWSSSNTFAWTPTSANANYRMSVWARGLGSSEYYEATTESYFAITAPPAQSTRVTSVTLSANRVAPQPINTTITWTAAPTGGTGHLYKWWFFDGATWRMVRDWSSSNTFVWTPTTANPNYRMSVWVKSGSNPADLYEASTESYFAIR